MTDELTERAEILATLDNSTRDSSTYTILFHQAVADQLGLNVTDHKILDLLARLGSMPAGQLAEITGLTTGAITGVIDRLEKAGYAQRERDPQDRRKVIVRLVAEKADREIAPLFAVLSQTYNPISQEYSNEELKVILKFMQQSVESMKQAIAILRGRPNPGG